MTFCHTEMGTDIRMLAVSYISAIKKKFIWMLIYDVLV